MPDLTRYSVDVIYNCTRPCFISSNAVLELKRTPNCKAAPITVDTTRNKVTVG